MTSAVDRERVGRLLEQLGRLAYGPEGRVAMLVETPVPGRHEPRPSVTVVAGKGFAGDHPRKSFYRGRLMPGREVTAVSLDVLRVLGVDPLVVGDNMIVEGFDLTTLEPGDRIQAGDVVLERSDPEHRPCVLFRDRTSPEAFVVAGRDRYRGALFVVREGGALHVGDPVRRISESGGRGA